MVLSAGRRKASMICLDAGGEGGLRRGARYGGLSNYNCVSYKVYIEGDTATDYSSTHNMSGMAN